MEDTDVALVRAWDLFLSDTSEEVEAELETLLPTLIAAGYVESDDWKWRFTPRGVARAEALTDDRA